MLELQTKSDKVGMRQDNARLTQSSIPKPGKHSHTSTSPHLCTNHHVLDDVVHVRDERGDVRVQQHHQRPAHVLAYIWVVVHCQVE